ncbi:MAG TPA: DNA-formamidopyrimidine glycosylase family protein [Acidimicrobiales bacterium]
MPEGDTLFRTAATLHRWLAGRTITDATTIVDGLPASKLVGQTVENVEANGKHLLIRLDSGQTLHSHMKMTGSWHVYRAGEPWRKPRFQARLTLTCGDRVAVCFNAPVVELLQPRAEAIHPALAGLGPDILDDPLDLPEIRRRARARPPETPLGELLLDQRIAAGIGNIWRCEALFVEHLNPGTPQATVTDEQLDALYAVASRLMRAQLGPFTGRGVERYVYNRAGRPCRRCRTAIEARRQGDLARTVYWCPRCQPPVPERLDPNYDPER